MKVATRGFQIAMAMMVLAAGARSAAVGVTLTFQAKYNISNNFSPSFYEASGLAIAKNESKLWSVGDENNFTMYKMALNGAAVSDHVAGPATGVSSILDASFEGVTYAPPPPGVSDDHFIYLVDENSRSVVPVNYGTYEYKTPKPLSSMAGWSSVVCQGTGQTVQQAFNSSPGNSGLEGITWNSQLSKFFLIKEKDPGLMIQISADLNTIQACKALTWSGADYSDIAYDSVRGKYWIVSDEGKSLALYDWASGGMSQKWNLTYGGGEGVAFNAATSQLFIVTDNGGGQTSYLYVYLVQ